MAVKNPRNMARIDKQLPSIAEAMNTLKAQIAAVRATLTPQGNEAGEPHSRVTLAERLEIIRLHRNGYSAVEISSVTKRSRRTISNVIQRYRKSATVINAHTP